MLHNIGFTWHERPRLVHGNVSTSSRGSRASGHHFVLGYAYPQGCCYVLQETSWSKPSEVVTALAGAIKVQGLFCIYMGPCVRACMLVLVLLWSDMTHATHKQSDCFLSLKRV